MPFTPPRVDCRYSILGGIGITLTLLAALLGGSRVPIQGELTRGPFLGVDWFLLNLIVYSAVFTVILVLTDFTQYWVHRAFHRVPSLWRFHQIHHSAEAMDWLAGSRLHLVDVAVTRGLTYVPIFVLGFAEPPLFAYVAFVSLQATFIHANVRFRFGALRWLLATPQFHHWHHSAEHEAVDKNFAVHLPVLDWLFGTFYLPRDKWPASYGLASGGPVPSGYVRQFVSPFLQRAERDN